MQDYLALTTTIIGLVFSSIALNLTWKVYKRENTLNNENYIYQKKFETYERLFGVAVEFLESADDCMSWLRTHKKNDSTFSKEEFEKSLEKFGVLEEKVQLELIKSALVLPETIINHFDDFLNGDHPWKKDINNAEDWQEVVDFYATKLENIHRLIIEDLHLKSLNKGIFLRLNRRRQGNL